jgi:negative regulator of sigma E activity
MVMNEPTRDPFEERSRALFQDSVESLDMRMRSRLTQARSAALASAAVRRPWYLSLTTLAPAAGVAAAAVLGVALWLGSPPGHQAGMLAGAQSNLEDLELVASSEEGTGDAMEMMQDDLDFYEFAAGSANPDTAA